MPAISPRKAAAEIIAAAASVFNLSVPYGVHVSLEPWGKGKRYVVAFCRAGTDFAARINRPDQIELAGAGPFIDSLGGTYDSPAALVAALYARNVAYDLELLDALAAGTIDPEHAIPAGLIGAIIARLPDGVRLPEPFYRVYQDAGDAELEAANAAAERERRETAELIKPY